jgi:acetyltransferase-like isoleucine patch superfamily enzyme
MIKGVNCRLGSNLHASIDTIIGDNVEIGNNVTIYPKVKIADGCRIFDGAIIGRMPLATNTITVPVNESYSDLTIGPGCIIGCNCVFYTGINIGRQVLVGDMTVLREDSVVADQVVIGVKSYFQPGVQIGKRSRIQGHAELGRNTIVAEDVFIGPSTSFPDDNNFYLSRFGIEPVSENPSVIKRLAVTGVGARILPGSIIGEGALVAAQALVSKDVPDWTVVAGVPARYVRDIPADWRKKIETMIAGRGKG